MSPADHTGTIAWLLNGNEGYGVASVLFALSGRLHERGWTTPILCMSDGEAAAKCRQHGYDVLALDVGIGPSIAGSTVRRVAGLVDTWRYERRARRALTAALRKIRPDVLEMPKDNLLGVGGAAANAVGAVPVWDLGRALSTRVPLQLNRRYFQRICRRHDITIIAASQYIASTVGDRPVKPAVVYNGVDAGRFDPERVEHIARRALGIPDDAVVFGIVGRLMRLKGQDRFLEAMLSIGEHDPPLHLLLLGASFEEGFAESLRSAAERAGASGRLHLPGPVDEPERYYAAMDIMVNTFIHAEGFGLTVVEAMMMGRPALVHALGGPAETVVDGETGWHVDQPTPDALAAGIRRALADRQRWDEMGRAARRRALDHFTIERQVEGYLEVINARLHR